MNRIRFSKFGTKALIPLPNINTQLGVANIDHWYEINSLADVQHSLNNLGTFNFSSVNGSDTITVTGSDMTLLSMDRAIVRINGADYWIKQVLSPTSAKVDRNVNATL